MKFEYDAFVAANNPNPEPGGKEEAVKEVKKLHQADLLVIFAEENADFFRDSNMFPYAKVQKTGEIKRIDDRPLQDWLLSNFCKQNNVPGKQALNAAIGKLSADAREGTDCRDVYFRVGQHEDTHYIDLANRKERGAIELKPGSWKIVKNHLVNFVRTDAMLPLVEPERDGDIAMLWKVLNIPEECRLLIAAWILSTFRLDADFPILELTGEHGSAKSTTQRMLRTLIDPNIEPLRAAPIKREDIFVGAGLNWLVSYENMSPLTTSKLRNKYPTMHPISILCFFQTPRIYPYFLAEL